MRKPKTNKKFKGISPELKKRMNSAARCSNWFGYDLDIIISCGITPQEIIEKKQELSYYDYDEDCITKCFAICKANDQSGHNWIITSDDCQCQADLIGCHETMTEETEFSYIFDKERDFLKESDIRYFAKKYPNIPIYD